jgi:hypothetical protein
MTACDNSKTNERKQTSKQEVPISNSKEKEDAVDGTKTAETIDLLITVGEKTFSSKLYNNQTTQELVKRFPLTVDMRDLNNNEKYYYLLSTLPTASQQWGEIYAGDIMLYGNDCLVLFYETFSSSYKYTRLGYIEDATGFAQAIGAGDVKVIFKLTQNTK